jgi:hypothetical protein
MGERKTTTTTHLELIGSFMKIQLQLIPAVLVLSAVTFAKPNQSSLKVGAADVTPAKSEPLRPSTSDHIFSNRDR